MKNAMHAHKLDHEIEVDAVNRSILLERRDTVGKHTKERKPNKGNDRTCIGEVEGSTPLKHKKLVAIDPNVSDLL